MAKANKGKKSPGGTKDNLLPMNEGRIDQTVEAIREMLVEQADETNRIVRASAGQIRTAHVLIKIDASQKVPQLDIKWSLAPEPRRDRRQILSDDPEQEKLGLEESEALAAAEGNHGA